MKENIDLQELLKIYTDTLCNKTFEFEIENGKNIRIVFFKESMCHLMGIHYVFGRDKHFLGAKGYKKIENGEMTEQSLKAHNRKGYNYIKNRLIYFDEIIDIIEKGEIYKFTSNDERSSRIKANIILNKDNIAYELNLFIIKDSGEDVEVFTPTSFFPLFQKDKDYKKFVKNKVPLKNVKLKTNI